MPDDFVPTQLDSVKFQRNRYFDNNTFFLHLTDKRSLFFIEIFSFENQDQSYVLTNNNQFCFVVLNHFLSTSKIYFNKKQQGNQRNVKLGTPHHQTTEPKCAEAKAFCAPPLSSYYMNPSIFID